MGRNLVLFFGLCIIFIRFSMIHQVLAYLVKVNLYLLYVFGAPAILAVLMSGGFVRVLKYRTAIYWVLFAAWVVAAVPFSTWKGGSAALVSVFLRTELIMMFIIGGVAVNRRDVRKLLYAVALGCVVNLFVSKIFGSVDVNDRVNLGIIGAVANSNDFAGHLIFVLPFLLWVAITAKNVIRLLAIGGLGWGVYLLLASGSRGAGVALVVGILFALLVASGKQRIMFLAATPILLAIAISLVPHKALQRIVSFSSSEANSSEEALLSSQIRQKLLQDSIKDMLQHPIFGVGPGQFSENEGIASRSGQGPGLWFQTHNSLTQVGSECGLPALLFYLLAIGSAYLQLTRTGRKIRDIPELADMTAAVFCMRLSLVSFFTAVLFLNFGYFFYLPAMSGMAIILDLAVENALKTRIPAPAAPPAALAFQVPPPTFGKPFTGKRPVRPNLRPAK